MEEYERRLAAHSARLSSEELQGPEHGRQRKRLQQKISQLKKTIAASSSRGMKRPRSSCTTTDVNKRVRCDDDAEVLPLMSKKQMKKAAKATKVLKVRAKKQTMYLNRQLASLAQRKQLARVIEAFTKALRQGKADVHTYANVLNAYVRCGDVAGALTLLRKMDTGTSPRPNVVAYTSVIKGLCTAGDLSGASDLLLEMERRDPPLVPNLRTANTFLRGCVRVGAVGEAEAVVRRMQDRWGVQPDATTYEHIVVLLCQALRLDAAWGLVEQLRAAAAADAASSSSALPRHLQGSSSSSSGGHDLAGEADAAGNPAIYTAMARAAALIGSWRECEAALDWADEALEADNFLKRQRQEVKPPPSSAQAINSSTGKPTVSRSIRQFARHRREELQRDVTDLRAVVEAARAARTTASARRAALLDTFFRRVVYFDPIPAHQPRPSSGDEPADVAATLVRVLWDRFGLHQCVRLDQGGDADPANAARCETIRAGALDSEGFIDFPSLFAADGDRPLKLEVGAGTGEWALAQARHDAGRANWATLELRHDRVYSTFARAALSDARNLCAIGGDALDVLDRRVRPHSVASLFVNHPEPPERTGGTDDSQGAHMLTARFFRLALRVLVPKSGTITIVTDNLAYGKSLIRTAAEAGLTSAGCDGGDEEDSDVKACVGGVSLRQGLPGPECGHSTAASSYFDRLWKEGDKVKRYWFSARERRQG